MSRDVKVFIDYFGNSLPITLLFPEHSSRGTTWASEVLGSIPLNELRHWVMYVLRIAGGCWSLCHYFYCSLSLPHICPCLTHSLVASGVLVSLRTSSLRVLRVMNYGRAFQCFLLRGKVAAVKWLWWDGMRLTLTLPYSYSTSSHCHLQRSRKERRLPRSSQPWMFHLLIECLAYYDGRVCDVFWI